MKIYLTETEAKNIKIPKGKMLNVNINYKKNVNLKPRLITNVYEIQRKYFCGYRWVFIEHNEFLGIETLENLIRDIDFYFENQKSKWQREYIGTWKID